MGWSVFNNTGNKKEVASVDPNPAWGNASVSATKTNVQSPLTGTWTSVTFDTEILDNDGMHSTVTNTDRLTVSTAGAYLPMASIGFVANTTGIRALRIRKNAAGSNLAYHEGATNPGGSWAVSVAGVPTYMAAGDYFTVEAFQSSGGSLQLAQSICSFGATRVGYQTNPSLPRTKIGSFVQTGGVTGNRVITGLGFMPTMVEFSASSTLIDNAANKNGHGAMHIDGTQHYIAGTSIGTASARASGTNRCLSTVGSGGALDTEMVFVSMDTDGFTINVLSSNADLRVNWRAYS